MQSLFVDFSVPSQQDCIEIQRTILSNTKNAPHQTLKHCWHIPDPVFDLNFMSEWLLLSLKSRNSPSSSTCAPGLAPNMDYYRRQVSSFEFKEYESSGG
jgi:hypothetical protein